MRKFFVIASLISIGTVFSDKLRRGSGEQAAYKRGKDSEGKISGKFWRLQ